MVLGLFGWALEFELKRESLAAGNEMGPPPARNNYMSKFEHLSLDSVRRFHQLNYYSFCFALLLFIYLFIIFVQALLLLLLALILHFFIFPFFTLILWGGGGFGLPLL